LRYNRLISVVRGSLVNVGKAIRGEVPLSVELEQVYNSIYNNMVPDVWAKRAYPSLKPLASGILDCLERFVKFISKNAYIQVSNYIQPSFSFSYKILNHFILLCRLVSLERTSVPPLGMLSYSF
jgi:dynein heavy chain